ncbi:MAG: hypothetical protein WAV40_03350 [Microgenomates group bacterium]
MRKKRDIDEEIEAAPEGEAELSEKDQKKKRRADAVEKRKNAKKKDKVARWGGLILLGLIMFIGFLLWVSGEMKQDIKPLNNYTITPMGSQGTSSVIVK